MKRNKSNICDEAELWDRLRAGSEEAFAIIYENFVDILFSYGCKLEANKDVVKDCLQDLFVRLWHHHASLGPTTSIKYYLFRSLRREIALQVKQNKKSANNSLLDENETSPEQKWIDHENVVREHGLLEGALQQLSDRQREAIYLKFYQNMDFSEIASLLDITPRAVYKLIYRAIDTLQKSYASPATSALPTLHISFSDLRIASLLAFAVYEGLKFPL